MKLLKQLFSNRFQDNPTEENRVGSSLPMAPPNRRSSILVRKGSAVSSPMKEIELDQHYTLIKKLGTGKFSTVYMAEDKQTKTLIALRSFSKNTVKPVDFIREYNFSYFLSPHPNIVDTYEGTYTTVDSFLFVQDYIPYGNLREAVENSGSGLQDVVVQMVVGQIVSALEFMHTEGLVHRNINANNVLVFAKDLSKVRISDFGMTRQQGTLIKHTDSVNYYHAPELCEILQHEGYVVEKSIDIWALGILIYYCLRAQYPWSKASIMCKAYYEWEQWLKRKTLQLPNKWARFSEDGLKLFRRMLSAKPKDRCAIKDVKKFLKDKWVKEVKVSRAFLFLLFLSHLPTFTLY